MKKSIVILSALALVALSAISCKGRHADATPTGDTVEVIIESGSETATGLTTESAIVPSDSI